MWWHINRRRSLETLHVLIYIVDKTFTGSSSLFCLWVLLNSLLFSVLTVDLLCLLSILLVCCLYLVNRTWEHDPCESLSISVFRLTFNTTSPSGPVAYKSFRTQITTLTLNFNSQVQPLSTYPYSNLYIGPRFVISEWTVYDPLHLSYVLVTTSFLPTSTTSFLDYIWSQISSNKTVVASLTWYLQSLVLVLLSYLCWRPLTCTSLLQVPSFHFSYLTFIPTLLRDTNSPGESRSRWTCV